MKIHIGICPNIQKILLSKLTDNSLKDIEVMTNLLDEANFSIGNVYEEALYDTEKCFEGCLFAIFFIIGVTALPLFLNIDSKP
jgi:hypothetical protein